MKRLGVMVVVLMVAVVLYRPATGQDNYEDRVSSLETRVSVLEAAMTESASPEATVGDVMTATVRLVARDYALEDLGNGECRGTDDFHFRGLEAGARPDVLDSEEDVIGTATINEALLTDAGEFLTCELHISTTPLPSRYLYRLQLGDVGEFIETRSALEAAGWHIDETIN